MRTVEENIKRMYVCTEQFPDSPDISEFLISRETTKNEKIYLYKKNLFEIYLSD